MHWSYQTPSTNNTREDSMHGYQQMDIFVAKDGETLYSQQKQDWELVCVSGCGSDL